MRFTERETNLIQSIVSRNFTDDNYYVGTKELKKPRSYTLSNFDRFNPTISNSNIFRINTQSINERIHVDYIPELESHVVYVDDFYLYPLALRKYYEKTPYMFSRETDNTHYPGLVSARFDAGQYAFPQISFFIEELIERYLIDSFEDSSESKIFKKYWRKFGKTQLDSAIYSATTLSVENSIIGIHKDSDQKDISNTTASTSVAGLVYLNLDSECDGGTRIYNNENEPGTLYDFEMKFNRLILYPSFLTHSFYTTKEDAWEHSWRIIQRVFYYFSLPTIIEFRTKQEQELTKEEMRI
jgi:hypothetical protein